MKNKYCRRCLVNFKSRQAYIRHIQSGHKIFFGVVPDDKTPSDTAHINDFNKFMNKIKL